MSDGALIRITIMFLGPSAGFAGQSTAEIELPADTRVGDLDPILADRFPALAPALGSLRYAVNESFAEGTVALADGDELALIPPVSGG